MIFKGTLGTSGTIQDLPTASSANEGFTYKVIEDGTYGSVSAKVGDVFVSNGSVWILIPAGDEPSLLTDLGDVLVVNPTGGQILIYDSIAGKWKNQSIPQTVYTVENELLTISVV